MTLKKTALLITVWLIASIASASPTTADYSTLPSIQMMRISPNGDVIAFRSQKNKTDILNIYSLAKGKSIRSLDLSEIDPADIYFINNTQLIFKGSNERKLPGFKGIVKLSTAYVLDIHTGELRQLLIPGKGIYLGQTGLGRILGVSKDGQYAFMPAFHSKDKRSSAPNYSLMKVNLKKTKTPRVHIKGNHHITDYFIDDDGNALAREFYDEKRNLFRIDASDIKSKKWRSIYTQETDVIDYAVTGLTPDRKSLIFIEEDSQSDRQNIYSMSLKDGTIKESEFGRDDADIAGTFTDINRVLHGVRYSGFKPSYKFFDPILDKRISDIVNAFPSDSVLLTDHSPDWSHIIVKVTGSSSPGDFYLFSQDQKRPRFLASARPNIKIEDIHPSTTVSYSARDGLNIPLLLTLPKDRVDSLKNLPAIMLPHGGPESHDSIGFNWLAQSFANQGYLVIQPQFRGSSGFGLNHVLAGRGEWGRKMQDDLTDGIEYLAKAKIVNKDKICIVGWSYGGYAALAGATFSPNTYQCAASINGVTELNRMLKAEKRDHGRHSQILTYWERNIGEGKASKQDLLDISPAANTEKINIPVLLIHASKDRVVKMKQAEIMHKAMEKSNKEVDYIQLKGDGHQILKQENRTLMLNALIGFVNKHIGPQ